VISEIDRVSVHSSNSCSSGSYGGSGVDVPVRNGVDVPDILGVDGAGAALGTIMRISKATCPVAVAIGFADDLAREILTWSYLIVRLLMLGQVLLAQTVTKRYYSVGAISHELTFGLATVIFFPLAVAQYRWNLTLAVFIRKTFRNASSRDERDLSR